MPENPDDPVSISTVHTHFLATELKKPQKTPVSKRSSFSPMSPLVFHYHSSHLDGKKNTHMLLTPTWQQQPRWPNVHVKPGWRLASCVASAQLPAAITKRKYLMSQTLELLIRSDSLSSPVPPHEPSCAAGKTCAGLKTQAGTSTEGRAGQGRAGQDRTGRSLRGKELRQARGAKVLNVIWRPKPKHVDCTHCQPQPNISCLQIDLLPKTSEGRGQAVRAN